MVDVKAEVIINGQLMVATTTINEDYQQIVSFEFVPATEEGGSPIWHPAKMPK